MKPILIIFFLFTVTNSFGQLPYFDVKGLGVRYAEKKLSQKGYTQSKETSVTYGVTMVTNRIEEASKNNLDFNTNMVNINYLDYKKVCNSYVLSPLKKLACTNKLNYLINAHKTVLSLMHSPTSNPINQGVKELTTEKYTHITNTILRALEEMKIESEKNILYNSIFNK